MIRRYHSVGKRRSFRVAAALFVAAAPGTSSEGCLDLSACRNSTELRMIASMNMERDYP